MAIDGLILRLIDIMKKRTNYCIALRAFFRPVACSLKFQVVPSRRSDYRFYSIYNFS